MERKETPQERYKKKHGKKISFYAFDRSEQDIVEHLDKQPNKSGYIKKLIRDDIARSKN